MRRRFKKNMAAVIAVSVAVSMCSVTAFASRPIEDNPKDKETIVKDFEEMQKNEGTVTDNDGKINNNEGTVTDNVGTINNNNGTVTNNYGTVTDNKAADESHEKAGSITNNNGTVETNNGTVETNNRFVETNNGDIDTNKGSVETNTEDGTIKENADNGVVKDNYGTITENSAKSSDTSQEQNKAEGNGGVENNYGTIVTNSGFVENNEIKEATESDPEDYVGTIKKNTGTVMTNNAVIEDNSGTVDKNGKYAETETGHVTDESAIVNYNFGTVTMNNGVVSSFLNGKVIDNNGTVYNHDNSSVVHNYGTEYFHVNVSEDKGLSVSYADGFTYVEDNSYHYLKETYSLESNSTTKTSSTVTVKPSSGYTISEFNIPKEYEGIVTATKGDDGTWTLSVSSGYNVYLSPIATMIENKTTTPEAKPTTTEETSKAITVTVSVSSDSDSSDDSGSVSNNFTASSNQNNMQAPPSSMMNPQLTVNSVDFMGMGLSAQLSDVLKPIDNLTAINNFTATGAQLPSKENMMACGIVDFQNAFVNAATGSVDVPVTANVIAGQTYTVALSNGQTLQVTCMANGVLNIPFMANAQNLTFIIYGMQANPAMMMFAGDTNQFQDALAGLTP